MFTGLIETLGTVVAVDGASIAVRPATDWDDPIEIGESIAINGTCLTVVSVCSLTDQQAYAFDVSPETFRRTALGSLKPDSLVNLERAMKFNERLGGHLVQGHVDATGMMLEKQIDEQFSTFSFQAPPSYDRYLIDKGSIAIDGISLTVVEPLGGKFSVWIIPTTLDRTNLQQLEVGDPVNLEFDLIAKYVEKLTAGRATAR